MTDIPYRIIRSQRKTISLEISSSGNLLVRCPQQMSQKAIDAFLESKRSWIESHRTPRLNAPKLPPLTMEEIEALADRALADLPPRVARFAPKLGVTYGAITIRNQRTRWGSCSSKGNLNFNCLLMLCPEDVRDYIVVHELCHRREMNHSPRFWALVKTVLPSYSLQEQWLKEHGGAIIARMTRQD